MKNVLVTGGFGFIGSHLTTALLQGNCRVFVIDDFSTGDRRFIDNQLRNQVTLHQGDLCRINVRQISEAFGELDVIFHIAANADVRGGWQNTYRDIEQNIIATHKVAELARATKCKELIFTSTGCVYGDTARMPTPENYAFPIQTSLYGASKVASEGILSSYAAQGAFHATVFRFVSVLGRNYHHGHVIDFVRQLVLDRKRLVILGNGSQKKSYINVRDCVEALINLRDSGAFSVFNIGNDYYIDVQTSARIIADVMQASPKIITGSSDRGWIGDNPFTFLDISKAKSQGWKPRTKIEESIIETTEWILQNQWILEKKDPRFSL